MSYGALIAPAADAFPITPHNTNVHDATSLWVGGAGHVAVTTEVGTDVTFNSVAAGTLLPIRVIRVRATGTTATNIVGLRAY